MKHQLNYLYLLLTLFMVAGCSSVPKTVTIAEPQSHNLMAPADKIETAQLKTKETATNLSLQAALSLALINNPELQAFSWEVRATEALKLQAGLIPNPEIKLELGEYDAEGTGFDTAETSITLSQLILLGGKRSKRRTVAGLERDLSEQDYNAKRLDVFAETTQKFIDLLAAQKSVTLAKETLSLATKVHATANARVEAGKVSPLEESRTSIDLSMSKMLLVRSERELTALRTQLGTMWGNTQPTFTEVTGSLKTIMDAIPPIALLTEDLSQNPDVARWENEIKLREASVALERSIAIPDLSASAGLQQFEETGNDALKFGLGFVIPIFDRNQGNIKAAKHQLSKVDNEKLAAIIQVQSDLTAAYQNLTASHFEATTLQRDILPAAQSAFDAASSGYKHGKFGYLEVLDAQRTMFSVRARYIKSLATYHKAVVTVERLIGRAISNPQSNL